MPRVLEASRCSSCWRRIFLGTQIKCWVCLSPLPIQAIFLVCWRHSLQYPSLTSLISHQQWELTSYLSCSIHVRSPIVFDAFSSLPLSSNHVSFHVALGYLFTLAPMYLLYSLSCRSFHRKPSFLYISLFMASLIISHRYLFSILSNCVKN